MAAPEFTPDYIAFARGTPGSADGYFFMAKNVPFTATNKATGTFFLPKDNFYPICIT